MQIITSMRDDCMSTLIILPSTPIVGPYWKMLAYCSSGMLETLHPISANCTTITSERKWFCSLLLCSAFAPYSLKTSKVLYLDEAFQFYSAIKSRGYYKTADKYVGNIYSASGKALLHTKAKKRW